MVLEWIRRQDECFDTYLRRYLFTSGAIEKIEEAIDWYQQRIDASDNAELAAVLAHNRDEEKEHACMVLEWIRRRDPCFDAYLRRYLFTSGAIEKIEEAHEAGGSHAQPEQSGTLCIGSLRAAEAQ